MTMAKPIECVAPSLLLHGVGMSVGHSAHIGSLQVILLSEVKGRGTTEEYMGLSNYEFL